LTQHRLIAAASGNEHFDWRFGPTGATVVRVKPKLIVTTNEAAIDAACSGFGIVRLLSYQVGQQLADRSLVQVLGQFDGPSLPVHVVHRSGKQGAAKIRRFIDLMVERLRADPCLR
jgi:DNA-binding transcriptional LysR family regulator